MSNNFCERCGRVTDWKMMCPNHHKEFDFGRVEIIEQTPEFLHGKLNGKEFKIALPRAYIVS